jgi:uncharacterized protein
MKNKKKIFFSFLVVILLFLGGFFLIIRLTPSPLPLSRGGSDNIQSVKIAGQNIKVDLALTPAEQEQGLSGRQNLLPNTGMLFVFENPDDYLFWMKDMNFPIDIIWISQDFKVVYIEKNATPESYPAAYGPGPNDEKAKYVLEVVSGFSDKNNLRVGDSVLFTY